MVKFQVQCGMSGSPWGRLQLCVPEGRGHPPTFRMGVLSLGDGGLSSVFTAGVLTRTSLWAGSS